MNKYVKPFILFLVSLNALVVIITAFRISQASCSCPNGYGITEFLINYQGGFVRRGLIGEILFQICTCTHLDPRNFIIPTCALAAIAYIIFIIALFRKDNISLWILPTSYTLFGGEIIRKDYIIMLLILAIIYLLKRNAKAVSSKYLYSITGISILMLNIHEASFFIISPLTFIYILFSSSTQIKTWKKWVNIAIIVSMFALLSIYKGNHETANSIGESWRSIASQEYANLNDVNNSIQALTWSLGYAADFHLGVNFSNGPIWKYSPIIMRPLAILLVLYILVHVSLSRKREDVDLQKLIVKFVNYAIFIFVSLSPMFTILSCDLQRVCFYWTMTTLMCFIILRDTELSLPYSALLQKATIKISRAAMKTPPLWAIYVLLLFFSVPYWQNTPSGYLSPLFTKPFKVIQQLSMK